MDEQLISHVAKLKDACKSYNDEQSKGRTAAQEYYAGEMKDMPSDKGRSSVVSQDVRAVVKKIMPSLTRTLLSNDRIVEYEPVGPEDEQGAEQATDYVNYVVVPEADVATAIYDAVHDACVVKTGILKWSAYEESKAVVYDYSDQPDDAVIGLMDDPDNEILDHEKSEETDPEVLALDPNARRHSFRLKRIQTETCIKLEAVARERFLISPGADDIESAEMTGEQLDVRRTDLVAMGYDKKQVWKLSTQAEVDDEDDERSRMGDDWSDIKTDARKALEEVVVWEVYVRLDSDDDGIAELWRVVFGEGQENEAGRSTHIILGEEIVSEAPYAEVVVERDPHQFEGHSLEEDTRDVQKVKTALLRGTLDNVYQVRDPRPIVDYSAVENPEEVASTEFGSPILLKPGRNASEVVNWLETPYIADKLFPMLEYWDEVARDRTGITDASGGMTAEDMTNVNNGVAVLMNESGVAQADAIVRSVTHGLRKAFRGLLKLVIAHADQPRTVRIRGEWQQYDPRVWNVDMDCTINVGLGGGTRERDLAVLQMVLGIQREVLASLGPDNPYVKPDQLYNTFAKIVETAGFPNADPYFTEPDMQEVQQKLQEAASKPDPEVQKVEMQGEIQKALEQMKAQTTMQVEQMKAELGLKAHEMESQTTRETNRLKEEAQLQADMQTKAADRQAEWERWQGEMQLEREKMESAERMKQIEIRADLEKAAMQREASVEAAKHKPQGAMQ